MAMEKNRFAHPNPGIWRSARTTFVSAVLGFHVLASPVMAGVDSGTPAISAPKNDKAKLNSELLKAVKKNDAAAVERLLDQGADIEARDGRGWTPLMNAIHAGRIENAKLLIAKNADANAKDKRGWTALMTAIFGGDAVVGRLLIEKGADVNAKDNLFGNTALMVVLVNSPEYDKFTALLIEKGADVHVKNNEGMTPLMEAAFFGYKTAAGLLIAHGADVDAKDNNGKTALSYAVERGHGEIAEMLKKQEAKE